MRVNVFAEASIYLTLVLNEIKLELPGVNKENFGRYNFVPYSHRERERTSSLLNVKWFKNDVLGRLSHKSRSLFELVGQMLPFCANLTRVQKIKVKVGC